MLVGMDADDGVKCKLAEIEPKSVDSGNDWISNKQVVSVVPAGLPRRVRRLSVCSAPRALDSALQQFQSTCSDLVQPGQLVPNLPSFVSGFLTWRSQDLPVEKLKGPRATDIAGWLPNQRSTCFNHL